jgi:hypothetical protein
MKLSEQDTGRPRIAFFGHPDVFEDFYPRYHIDQLNFATKWANTGSYAVAVLSKWGVVAESIPDEWNDVLQNTYWSPEEALIAMGWNVVDLIHFYIESFDTV